LGACALFEKLRGLVITALTALARAATPNHPPTKGKYRSNAPSRRKTTM
jgi:hypothetical protein